MLANILDQIGGLSSLLITLEPDSTLAVVYNVLTVAANVLVTVLMLFTDYGSVHA
ncbi:MAG: hypothetical protein ACLFTT_15305 [Candidatus Hydrogenedentota bacterium]